MDNQTAQQTVAIAVLETKVEHLNAVVGELKTSIAALTDTVGKMHSMLDQAKGGWRVMLLVGGAAGTLGAALSQLLPNWRPLP